MFFGSISGFLSTAAFVEGKTFKSVHFRVIVKMRIFPGMSDMIGESSIFFNGTQKGKRAVRPELVEGRNRESIALMLRSLDRSTGSRPTAHDEA
jgi:hypothetical protein